MRKSLLATLALFVPPRAPCAAAPAGAAHLQSFVATFDFRGETVVLERL
ncbi:MAG: hypothetical protein LC795_02685 [Acidobacteria bacterium]|nr:hypothetical protein [Acidobacteriota bacterium]